MKSQSHVSTATKQDANPCKVQKREKPYTLIDQRDHIRALTFYSRGTYVSNYSNRKITTAYDLIKLHVLAFDFSGYNN